ncbi:MAG: efflux RND transporter periplasmic adaptor subunit [Rhodospirillales bacterium]
MFSIRDVTQSDFTFDFSKQVKTMLQSNARVGKLLCWFAAVPYALAISLIISFFIPNHGLAQAKPKGVLVEAEILNPVPLTEYVSAVGDLASEASVIVRPEIAGRIKEIRFKEGAPVKQGDLLVGFDDAIYRAEVDQAEARAALSGQNLKRANTLSQRGHTTAQTLDVAREENHINEASVELARARHSKTKILAPFDGVIGLKKVSVGDYVQAGAEIVNLERIATLTVDFRVPERYLRVAVVGGKVEIELDAFPGTVYEGTIYAVDPRVRTADRSVAIRARLDNSKRQLRPGLFARIRLIVGRQVTAIVVPEEAIIPRGDRRYVFRIVDEKALLSEVRTGLRETGRVEIVGGLKPGDQNITAGQAKVRNGSQVRIVGGSGAKSTSDAKAAKE